MYIFFIHSLVEGHLSCFQVLAIMTNAAMIIVDQRSSPGKSQVLVAFVAGIWKAQQRLHMERIGGMQEQVVRF